MSYQPRPFASDDTLLSSRDTIRGNFEIIQNRFQNDHTDFDSGTGKHDKMTMPVQSPDPTCAASEGLLFCKTSSAKSELFYDRDAAGTPIQLTVGDPVVNITGQSFLPGGIILKWGTTTASSSSTQSVTFSSAFPTGLLNVQLTANRASSSPGTTFGFWVSTAGYTTAGFTIYNQSGHSYAFQWLAIGY